MGLIKIFSGSEILAISLKGRIEEKEINVVMKNNIQSGRLAGFGTSDMAVELFIEERDFHKANPIIEDFKMNI